MIVSYLVLNSFIIRSMHRVVDLPDERLPLCHLVLPVIGNYFALDDRKWSMRTYVKLDICWFGLNEFIIEALVLFSVRKIHSTIHQTHFSHPRMLARSVSSRFLKHNWIRRTTVISIIKFLKILRFHENCLHYFIFYCTSVKRYRLIFICGIVKI